MYSFVIWHPATGTRLVNKPSTTKTNTNGQPQNKFLLLKVFFCISHLNIRNSTY